MELEASTVRYGGRASGYFVKPSRMGRLPAVIVIQEIWGLEDHIKDVARRFAEEGYVTLAPDLYGGKLARTIEEGRALRASFPPDKFLRDLSAGVEFLRQQSFVDPERIGTIGFCMGGGLSLLTAINNPVAACVVFYGVIPDKEEVARLSCPLLGIFAERDESISPQLPALEAALKKFGRQYEFKIYEGASHAFFNDRREKYHPTAARDAWERTLKFFERHLRAA